MGKQKQVYYSEMLDKGLNSHLSRNYKEKSMAALVGNLPSLFLIFSILFLGLSHRELALNTEVYVILAVREIRFSYK